MTPIAVHPPAETLFLPGRAGALYVRYQPARDDVRHRADMIVVPPFAEEMNKSRRMFTLLAERLATVGVGTAVVDLFGTGDSEGEFADARYEIWLDDLTVLARWLRARGARTLGLVGLRFGCLLAADFARRATESIERLVLWQPIASGESMITQFLRLRVAAGMTSRAEEKETTAALRERLRAGEAIEVAGYTLAPELVAAIDVLRLESLATSGFPPLSWFELATEQLPPASRRLLETLQGRGIPIDTACLPGPPFWGAVEIATAPALIVHTTQIFANRAAA